MPVMDVVLPSFPIFGDPVKFSFNRFLMGLRINLENISNFMYDLCKFTVNWGTT